MRTTILVVEDDRLTVEMLSDILAPLRATLLHATHGMQALALAWDRLPDLILLDLVMPRLDGFEVASILRGSPRTRHIPVIFITADERLPSKVRGLEMGEDYITKPFVAEEVRARVKRTLRQAADPFRFHPPGRPLPDGAPEAAGAQIAGKLEEVSLPTLIQLLSHDRVNGTLLVVPQDPLEGHGTLHLAEGGVTGAEAGRLRGEAAALRVLGWERGRFELLPPNGRPPASVQVSSPTPALVLEAAQRKDELRRLLSGLPPLESVLIQSPRLLALLGGRRPSPELRRFLGLFDGRRSIRAVLEESDLDEIAALDKTARLFRRGCLIQKPRPEVRLPRRDLGDFRSSRIPTLSRLRPIPAKPIPAA
jgi:CheY-like chemotaxis protein